MCLVEIFDGFVSKKTKPTCSLPRGAQTKTSPPARCSRVVDFPCRGNAEISAVRELSVHRPVFHTSVPKFGSKKKGMLYRSQPSLFTTRCIVDRSWSFVLRNMNMRSVLMPSHNTSCDFSTTDGKKYEAHPGTWCEKITYIAHPHFIGAPVVLSWKSAFGARLFQPKSIHATFLCPGATIDSSLLAHDVSQRINQFLCSFLSRLFFKTTCV